MIKNILSVALFFLVFAVPLSANQELLRLITQYRAHMRDRLESFEGALADLRKQGQSGSATYRDYARAREQTVNNLEASMETHDEALRLSDGDLSHEAFFGQHLRNLLGNEFGRTVSCVLACYDLAQQTPPPADERLMSCMPDHDNDMTRRFMQESRLANLDGREFLVGIMVKVFPFVRLDRLPLRDLDLLRIAKSIHPILRGEIDDLGTYDSSGGYGVLPAPFVKRCLAHQSRSFNAPPELDPSRLELDLDRYLHENYKRGCKASGWRRVAAKILERNLAHLRVDEPTDMHRYFVYNILKTPHRFPKHLWAARDEMQYEWFTPNVFGIGVEGFPLPDLHQAFPKKYAASAHEENATDDVELSLPQTSDGVGEERIQHESSPMPQPTLEPGDVGEEMLECKRISERDSMWDRLAQRVGIENLVSRTGGSRACDASEAFYDARPRREAANLFGRQIKTVSKIMNEELNVTLAMVQAAWEHVGGSVTRARGSHRTLSHPRLPKAGGTYNPHCRKSNTFGRHSIRELKKEFARLLDALGYEWVDGRIYTKEAEAGSTLS